VGDKEGGLPARGGCWDSVEAHGVPQRLRGGAPQPPPRPLLRRHRRQLRVLLLLVLLPGTPSSAEHLLVLLLQGYSPARQPFLVFLALAVSFMSICILCNMDRLASYIRQSFVLHSCPFRPQDALRGIAVIRHVCLACRYRPLKHTG
jgi:hypothetical protein